MFHVRIQKEEREKKNTPHIETTRVAKESECAQSKKREMRMLYFQEFVLFFYLKIVRF